jgi:hypothetical protein
MQLRGEQRRVQQGARDQEALMEETACRSAQWRELRSTLGPIETYVQPIMA